MKFDCDRCKTRYSIADERVRGKILKIRCKNCSAVITVREGRAEASQVKPVPSGRTGAVPAMRAAPAAAVGRSAGSTGASAAVSTERGASTEAPAAPALRSAFDRVMQSGAGAEKEPSASQSLAAPASLDEEWYVSENGDQVGPFSLVEAQRVVAVRAPEADLYCWCEGFDDWLPVDKVKQFRGVRDRAATVPLGSPTPIASAARRVGSIRPPGESTPAPLFDKTLRAIEEENGETAEGVPLAKADGAKANGAKANGAFGRATTAPPPLPRTPTGPAAKLADGDDADDDAFAAGARAALLEDDDDEDEHPAVAKPKGEGPELEIGEVSRVVNIASIIAAREAGRRTQGLPALEPAAEAAARLGRGTDSTAAITGAAAGGGLVGAAAPGLAAAPMVGALSPEVMASARPEVLATKSRNPHVALYAGLALAALLAGGIVLWVVSRGGDGGGRGGVALGNGPNVEELGYRFDNPAGRRTPAAGAVAEVVPTEKAPTIANKAPTKAPTGTGLVRPATNNGTTTGGTAGKVEVRLDDKGEPLTALSPDDIIRTSSRSSFSTRRCYERALKQDPFLEVKRIVVDLRVDAAGAVTSVTLSEKEDSLLGQCLIGVIRRWSFRASTEGISTKIPLVFEQN